MLRIHYIVATLVLLTTACKTQDLPTPKPTIAAMEYTDLWQQVDSLNKQGLVETSDKIVDSILRQSQSESNSPEYIKAIIYKVASWRQNQEDGPQKAIEFLHQEEKQASRIDRAILQSILGEVYMHYLQRNQWKIQEREYIDGPSPSSLQEWSVRRFVEVADYWYLKSLDDPALLGNTSITDYNRILTESNNAEGHRPTILDFLSYRAIEQFRSGNRPPEIESQAHYALESNLLEGQSEFLKTPRDTNSSYGQILYILQNLLAFHRTTNNDTARLHTDMYRLQWAHSTSLLANKDSLYMARLDNIASGDGPEEILAEALLHKVNLRYQQVMKIDDPSDRDYTLVPVKQAYQKIKNKYPDTRAALEADNKIQALIYPQVSVEMNPVQYPAKPGVLSLHYSNIDKLHLHIVRIPKRKFHDRNRDFDRRIEDYKKMESVQSWTIDIGKLYKEDHKQHRSETVVPGLEAGLYGLMISSDSEFNPSKAYVCLQEFQVTSLAHWVVAGEQKQLQVLDRWDGKPLSGVHVEVYPRPRYNQSFWSLSPVWKGDTDQEGMVSLPFRKDYLFVLKKDDEVFYDMRGYNSPGRRPQFSDVKRTHFFTDRALYRPGQIVHFSGIRYLEKPDDLPSILPGTSSEYVLLDPNGQEVHKATLTSDEFGAVSGQFAIPLDRIAGNYTLRNVNDYSSASIRVEKYLRPQFEAKLKMTEQQFVPGDEVTLKGEALAYAGYGLQDARVRYRVHRSSFVPYLPWSFRFCGYRPQRKVLVATGETTTDNQGEYTVTFEALADHAAKPQYQPVFRYSIEVDITDINGETQSTSGQVSVGFTPIVAQLTPKKLYRPGTSPKLSAKIFNHDGQPSAGNVKVVIEKLRNPENFIPKRNQRIPDQPLHSKKEWKGLLPHLPYADEGDPMTWPSSDSVQITSMEMSEVHSLGWPSKFDKPGSYRIRLQANGTKGNTYYSSHILHILPEKETLITDELWSDLSSTDSLSPEADFLYQIYSPVSIAPKVYMGQDHGITSLSGDKPSPWITKNILIKGYGGFTMLSAFYWKNEFRSQRVNIPVPYRHKKLNIKLTTFRDLVIPSSEEEVEFQIQDHLGQPVDAQVVASLYDQSLDAFLPHQWNTPNPFPSHFLDYNRRIVSPSQGSWAWCHTNLRRKYNQVPMVQYHRLFWPFERYHGAPISPRALIEDNLGAARSRTMGLKNKVPEAELDATTDQESNQDFMGDEVLITGEPTTKESDIRSDLAETVFFESALKSSTPGQYKIRYTMKEALTRWKLLLFAHTRDLQMGQTETTIVTQKDLSLQILAPRFVRQGDRLQLPVKVVNLTEESQTAQLELQITDLYLDDITKDLIGGGLPQLTVTLEAGEAQNHYFDIAVPEDCEGGITIRARVSGEAHTDGEQKQIPVLAKDILVTEAVPLTVRAGETRQYSFDNWETINRDTDFRPYQVTVEFSSNPAWYAVQALPYLTENPHSGSEQTFTRFYANALAAHVVRTYPSIKSIFSDWQSKGELQSALEKNPELKSVILQETPWVNEAKDQTQAMQRIALLFDFSRMESEEIAQLEKLKRLQNSDGSWSWFPGGRPNTRITLHILTLWGHLDALGVLTPEHHDLFDEAIIKAQVYLNSEVSRLYKEYLAHWNKDKNNGLDHPYISHGAIHYLYARARSSQWSDQKLDTKALDHYQKHVQKYWHRYSIHNQGMIAFILKDIGADDHFDTLIQSLIERSTQSDDLGQYWHYENGYGWYQRPIETHALMIELFSLVGRDKLVEELRIWLLQHKRTNHWGTTKSTAWAIYSLLCNDNKWTKKVDALPVKLGDTVISPSSPTTAGHLYYKETLDPKSLDVDDLSQIEITNTNQNLGFGAVYLQYFAPLDKIAPASDSPMNLRREIFVRKHGQDRTYVVPWEESNPLSPGDQLIIRLHIDVDRAMEFLHLQDYRAAGTEPFTQLSQYHWKSGLQYYETTDDVSMHFFIEHIQPGQHTIEYSLWVRQPGDYILGNSQIECLYAPEFRSHSVGQRMKISPH